VRNPIRLGEHIIKLRKSSDLSHAGPQHLLQQRRISLVPSITISPQYHHFVTGMSLSLSEMRPTVASMSAAALFQGVLRWTCVHSPRYFIVETFTG